MTKEEWYASPDFIKLRFLNNMAAGIQHKTQEFTDVLELILAEKPDLWVFDRFSLVERQCKIVNLEAAKLWERARKLADSLEPHQYDDICKRCNNKWQEDGKCPTCPATKPVMVLE
jgi:rubrerythrin